MSVSTLSFKTTHSQSDIRPVLDEALQREKDFAYTRFTIFAQECQAFEHTYHKGSDPFLQEFEAGALGDDEQWFDWYAALCGKMVWEKKYQILGNISWNE